MRLRKITLQLAAASLLVTVTYPALARDNSCFVRKLNKPPKWISTLDLNPQKGEILIADPMNPNLLAYDLKTERIGEIDVPGELPPTSITKIQGGFLVKYRDDAAIISPTYKTLKEKISIRSAKSGGVSGLGPLYSNWITKGSTFVGFGSVANFNPGSTQYNPSRRFELGFVKGQVNATSGEFRNIQLLEATEENDAYLLGFPYFAANDDGVFFVKMTSPRVSIVRVREAGFGTATLSEIPAFPEEFRPLPDLETKAVGASTLSERFDRIESSKMAAGLFGQGKYLYLLARQPDKLVDPSGGTPAWFLYQISPASREPLGVVRLPTNAKYLSIAPGQDFWYLFERGRVRAWGDQDINTVVKIPAKWIASPNTSPIRVEGSIDQSVIAVQCAKQ